MAAATNGSKPKGSKPARPAGLNGKLIEVRRRIAGVSKRGRNEHHDYDYQLAADIVAEVREHFDELGVLLEARVREWDRKGELTTVEVEYTLTDTDTGESRDYPWLGTGWDRGDKGLYKAYTGGLKYFLVQLFQIGTNDDPEGDTATDEGTSGVRQESPVIPRARAEKIAQRCQEVGVAGPVLKAKLTELGVRGISQLNVDKAEDLEAWLEMEGAGS